MMRGALLATAVAGTLSEESSQYFKYVEQFGKTPESGREQIFNANMRLISIQNADPSKTWVAGPNEFTDWTNEEFKAWRTSPQPPMPRYPAADVATGKTLLSSIDWRNSKGVVTPVKNQGQCGSCWAFSATETLESRFALATNEDAPILGPQQIVSCAVIPGAGGCNGGLQTIAFNYTEHAGGLTSEANYPYTAQTGTCDPSKIKPVVTNTGFVALKQNDYTALMTAGAAGPTAISVAAGGLGWQFYTSGVFTGGLFGCGFQVDHAVQLVGYGVDNSVMYWLVRNSWGSGWGESGYIRIKRFGEGKEPCGQAEGTTICGLCGILFANSYPTGVGKAGGILV